MTLKQIKTLFSVGDKVNVNREGNTPLRIVGNTGVTIMPANNGIEPRVVNAVKSMEWVMTKPDGRNVHTTYPKASEVIEAREGYLKFRYDNGTIITIEKT